MEAEGLVEALFDEIDRGAVDEGQAVRVDEHLYALVFEDEIGGRRIVGVVHDVGEPRAARLADSQAEAEALAPGGDEGVDGECGGSGSESERSRGEEGGEERAEGRELTVGEMEC